jgi:hypothetical protein
MTIIFFLLMRILDFVKQLLWKSRGLSASHKVSCSVHFDTLSRLSNSRYFVRQPCFSPRRDTRARSSVNIRSAYIATNRYFKSKLANARESIRMNGAIHANIDFFQKIYVICINNYISYNIFKYFDLISFFCFYKLVLLTERKQFSTKTIR